MRRMMDKQDKLLVADGLEGFFRSMFGQLCQLCGTKVWSWGLGTLGCDLGAPGVPGVLMVGPSGVGQQPSGSCARRSQVEPLSTIASSQSSQSGPPLQA